MNLLLFNAITLALFKSYNGIFTTAVFIYTFMPETETYLCDILLHI